MEDTSFNIQDRKIKNDPLLSNDLNKCNSSNILEKIILKNKINKIIKVYRNYQKKRELSTIPSTRNNTDRLQGNESLKNLIKENKNDSINSSNINNDNIKSHSVFQKNNNSGMYIGNKDSLGKKNGFGIQKWEDGSKFSCIFDHEKVNGWGIFIHNNGDIYKGEYLNDRTNGYGEYYRQNLAIYKGYWLNDSQYGIGNEIQIG